MFSLFSSKKQCLLLLLEIVLFLSACGNTTPEPVSTNELKKCTGEGIPNLYEPPQPQTTPVLIYERASSQTSDVSLGLQENQLENIRSEAFWHLTELVMRWSTYKDVSIPIQNGEPQVVRITLTYLSPDLVEMLVLNHHLSLGATISVENFYKKIRESFGTLKARHEIIFFVTISTSNFIELPEESAKSVLSFPVDKMKVIDSHGRVIFPTHIDPQLTKDMQLSAINSGYVMYPMFVIRNEKCGLILDEKWDTTMYLESPPLKYGGTEQGNKLAWSFKYHPLLEMELESPASLPMFAPDEISMIRTPPRPNLLSTADDSYWIAMTRYIWGYVIDP